MPENLKAIMKKSLKSNRWDHINLGSNESYTHDNMVARWVTEKNKWLQRQPVRNGPDAEVDVRGAVTSGPIPDRNTNAHNAIRRTMK